MLLAILMNPPTNGGSQTLRALRILEEVQQDDLIIVNLLAAPTKSFDEIREAGSDPLSWTSARPELSSAIRDADQIHAAWGVGALTGAARDHLAEQLRFIAQEMASVGQTRVGTLLGEPRHPSRWHQFLSPRHGRVPNEPLEARVRVALRQTAITDLFA